MSVAAGACGGDSNSGGIPSECNPLGGQSCLFPWPSSTYLTTDSTTATGFRVDIPPEAMPTNIDGFQVDPEMWNRFDGFTNAGLLIAAFDNGVGPANIPGPQDDISVSLSPSYPTAIINLTTGEPVVHFTERDENTDKDLERALLIRPLQRLQPNTRYAVAVRNVLQDSTGAPLARSPAFEAIVNGESFSHPRFDDIAAGYPEIFAAIEAHGIPRAELSLAWEFRTASDESILSDMMTLYEKGVPAMGDTGANLDFVVENERSADPEKVYKFLVGTHDSPNFLDDGETDRSVFIRGADTKPEQSGMYTANWAAIIPKCAETATLPLPTFVFGHGIFGTGEGYAEDDFLQEIADQKCMVVIAGDFIGLTERQVAAAAFSANDLNRSHGMVEKLGQGIINFIALEQVLRGKMATSPDFMINGEPVIDVNNVNYLGGSLGGILGAVFMYFDPHIQRGALGVPGANWSMLYERSVAWLPLEVAAKAALETQYDYQLLIALLGFSMERFDPISIGHKFFDDPLPGHPAKQLVYYEALNDSLVFNHTTEMMARELGLPVCGPSVKVPWNMTEDLNPAASAFIIFDENKPLPTPNNIPPADDNGTHGGVHDRRAVLDLIEHFFFQGEVINTCSLNGTPAPCDCSTGACD